MIIGCVALEFGEVLNMNNAQILVVDDDKNIRMLLSQCMEEAGYMVVSAVDGEHALKKVEETQFDLVLLDMKLPGMDGLQVLRKLRAADPAQPIVIITAHGTIETAVEAMKSGATDYLQKPFTPEEIRNIVRLNLSKPARLLNVQSAAGYDGCLREARELLANRQHSSAIPYLREAINLNPERPEPFNLLGIAGELSGDLDAARRMYRVALALDPSYSPAGVNLDRVSQWRYDASGFDLGQDEEATGHRKE